MPFWRRCRATAGRAGACRASRRAARRSRWLEDRSRAAAAPRGRDPPSELRRSGVRRPAAPAPHRARRRRHRRRWPLPRTSRADFVYLRLHGEKELYTSGYDDEALDRWAPHRDWRGAARRTTRASRRRGRRRRARDATSTATSTTTTRCTRPTTRRISRPARRADRPRRRRALRAAARARAAARTRAVVRPRGAARPLTRDQDQLTGGAPTRGKVSARSTSSTSRITSVPGMRSASGYSARLFLAQRVHGPAHAPRLGIAKAPAPAFDELHLAANGDPANALTAQPRCSTDASTAQGQRPHGGWRIAPSPCERT